MHHSYHPRHIEAKLKRFASSFKIVLVTGARQVGKSTLLNHVYPNYQHLVFDPSQDRYNARTDPDLFLKNFKAPLLLDEIQYVPELLPNLKRQVDQFDQFGQYFLTGSQNILMLKSVAESLAGRVGILHLEPMTPVEIADHLGHAQQYANWLELYLNDSNNLVKHFAGNLTLPYTLYELLWRGTMPGILRLKNDIITDYYHSYVLTYLERDVRLLENIRDLSQFNLLLRYASAMTAQEINQSQFAREIGMSPMTAIRWLAVLQHSYQWREVLPFSGNAIKRISKRRKGYIVDTGIACYLRHISTPQALAGHPALGALFETFCVSNIFKYINSLSLPVQVYHWRSFAGAEVDLILEHNGKYFPIEIKCKTTLNKHDTRGLRAFRETYPNLPIQVGLMIYAGQECIWLDKKTIALPWDAVFRNVQEIT